jgi:hypothetical protein
MYTYVFAFYLKKNNQSIIFEVGLVPGWGKNIYIMLQNYSALSLNVLIYSGNVGKNSGFIRKIGEISISYTKLLSN